MILILTLAASWAAAPRAQTPDEVTIRTPDYQIARSGYVYAFPRDHGAHPEYKLEWWYYTGQLESVDGERFGYELTFFRVGLDRTANNPSAWTVDHLHIAHFALSDLERSTFFFDERVNRTGPGVARAAVGTLDVSNQNWSARLVGDVIELRVRAGGIQLDLNLTPLKPPVIHGIDGVSQKADGAGRASHYYSLTRLHTTGRLSIDGRAIPVTGESWMDHEFGTNQLAPEQIGWDWFSLQLDNGEEVMLYQLRRRDGAADANSSGTVVAGDGASTHLPRAAFSIRSRRDWPSPVSEAVYRLDWEILIPDFDARLQVRPLMDEQEMVTTQSTGIAYWEGAVEVEGVWRGRPVTGRGYVELTGYSERDRPDV